MSHDSVFLERFLYIGGCNAAESSELAVQFPVLRQSARTQGGDGDSPDEPFPA